MAMFPQSRCAPLARRDALAVLRATPACFSPPSPCDAGDSFDCAWAGTVDAEFLAIQQRAANGSRQRSIGFPQSHLEIITLGGGREGYIACGSPQDVDELAALALAMIEQDGLGNSIVDVYRTADRTAAAIIVESGKGGAA